MKIDISGQRFGLLTAIEPAKSAHGRTHWVCKCDCGNTVCVATESLRSGHTKSCGCLKHKTNAQDLTGMTFGYLKVIRRVGIDKHRKSLWRCKCKCGRTTVVNAADLKSGNTKSCGCLHKQFAKNHPFQY